MLIAATVVLLSFGFLLGLFIYNFMEGETFLRDCFDELQLSRRSLFALDAVWLANPNKSDIFISLTTTPARIAWIAPCIKSLMQQSTAPAKIILNVPVHSIRENRDYVIPDFLRNLKALEIYECEDWGPATKLIPTLLRPEIDGRIIVVDDDRIYPKSLLQTLAAASNCKPMISIGLSGWVVPDDLVDRPTSAIANIMQIPPVPIRARRQNRLTRVDVLQGQSGYITSPRFFDLQAVQDYRATPSAAFFVDDVWFSAHCRVQKFVCPSPRSSFQIKRSARYRNQNGLGFLNRGPGGNERRNNSIMIKHFASTWMMGTS